jgi:hypothetical protein
MRLLAAFQNTTLMVMYPRRTEKKILREPLWAGVLRPSLAASRFFSAISFIWMMTSEYYSPKLARVRKADSPSLAGSIPRLLRPQGISLVSVCAGQTNIR